MLYVTHDQAEAARVASRVAVLEGGRILQVAPYETLRERPASHAVARVLGLRNVLPAEIVDGCLHLPSLGLRVPRADAPPGPLLAYVPPDRCHAHPDPGRRCARGRRGRHAWHGGAGGDGGRGDLAAARERGAVHPRAWAPPVCRHPRDSRCLRDQAGCHGPCTHRPGCYPPVAVIAVACPVHAAQRVALRLLGLVVPAVHVGAEVGGEGLLVASQQGRVLGSKPCRARISCPALESRNRAPTPPHLVGAPRAESSRRRPAGGWTTGPPAAWANAVQISAIAALSEPVVDHGTGARRSRFASGRLSRGVGLADAE